MMTCIVSVLLGGVIGTTLPYAHMPWLPCLRYIKAPKDEPDEDAEKAARDAVRAKRDSAEQAVSDGIALLVWMCVWFAGRVCLIPNEVTATATMVSREHFCDTSVTFLWQAFGTYASAGGDKLVYRVKKTGAFGGYKIVTEVCVEGRGGSLLNEIDMVCRTQRA